MAGPQQQQHTWENLHVQNTETPTLKLRSSIYKLWESSSFAQPIIHVHSGKSNMITELSQE